MIITDEKRLLSIYIHSAFDKRYTFFIIAGMAPVNHGGLAPVIHGGDLPSDRGGVAPAEFWLRGRLPPSPPRSRRLLPIIRSLKSKMAEIRHLENRHDVIFSAKVGTIWIKFLRLVQNDMSTAVMWLKSQPDVECHYGGQLGEFNGMSSRSHVLHCRVLPLGEFTVTIPTPLATLQGVRNPSAILKVVYFLFLMQFRLWRAAPFVSSPIHLLV